MKHHDPKIHLSDDDLLRAMIDPWDLDPGPQAHLESCRRCRRRTEELTRRFHHLGLMARQMAPKPRKSFRVPAQDAPYGRWHLKPAMALGVLGILVFAVTLWGPFTRIYRTPAPMVGPNVGHDDRLLEAIDTLVEDALPGKYRQLAALSDHRSVEDLDAFIDWVAPSPEETDAQEQPSRSGRESRQGPSARWDAKVRAEEGYRYEA